MILLALDFDGVIADSINECLVTANNAYSRFLGSDVVCVDTSGFSRSTVEAFRRMRPLIRRGEDYVFLMQAIENGPTLQSQADFDAFLHTNRARRDAYQRLFYEERARLQSVNLDRWLALNPMFPGMAEFLRTLQEPGATFVVTTKDLSSVRLIFEHHGVPIPESNLRRATKSIRKPAILDTIAERRLGTSDSLHFIDDHVATVLEANRESRARCLCARWGYNTAEQIASVESEGVEALTLDAFFDRYRVLNDSDLL